MEEWEVAEAEPRGHWPGFDPSATNTKELGNSPFSVSRAQIPHLQNEQSVRCTPQPFSISGV